ncbi:MAG: LCP family protein [Synechococcaceae cyanobacterium]|nr:LCP family protein [Synechococcaceae cyanobacterium]
MSQAHSHQPSPRRPRGRSSGRSGSPASGRRNQNLGAVPDLLSRRQSAPAPSPRPRGPHRLLVLGLGIAIGYGLAGPLPSMLGAALAGLLHAPRSIAAIVDPLGIGERRVLVMGSDVIGGNTDVMFTVQVKNGITHITQVPRDTFVETPELGVMKANALYASGGPESAKAEVGRLLAMPVQKHIKVNLNAVAKVADALGGVEVDVPKSMYYVDNAQGLLIDLLPGRQVLKGKDLEGFLRFRHDELGDLGRMERQRLVLAEVFRRLVQPATLTRLPALLQIAGEDIRTDLSPIEMTQLLTAMTRSKLSTQRLPGRLYWQDDLSYWMPDSNTAHPTGNGEEPPL